MPASRPQTETTVPDEETFAALLSRRSVRRYENRVAPEETRRSVVEFAMRVEPLVPENEFSYSVLPIVGKSEELATVMGGYGKLVSARHLVLPRIRGNSHILADFGFRVEQLVIHLTRLGLGSCWIAALGHEGEVLDRFKSPKNERIPAVVVFGYPSESKGGIGFNRSIRVALSAHRPPPYEKWVFAGRFDNPASLTPFQEKSLDALRRAPSAGNSRPWRVVLKDGEAHLTLKLDTPYYRLSKGVRLGYHLLDGGIGMSNLSMALSALGKPASWTMLDNEEVLRAELGLPDNYELLARITLPEA